MTMSQATVQRNVVTRVQQQSMSSGVKEIIALVDDPRTSVAKLTSAIYKNRGLMERVLRQANSPLYGMQRRVSDPTFAVVLLGFDALKEIVVRSLVTGAFRRMVNSVVRFEAFWNHSVGCGLGARMIAEETGVCDPTDAFVAGLLHDIGYIVLNENGHDAVKSTGVLLPTPARHPGNGTAPQEDHAEIGAWLIERWKLDSGVAEAIRYHHDPSAATRHEALVAVVHIAEVLCHHLHIGESGYESVSGYDPVALEAVDLDEAALTGGSSKGYVALFLERISRAPKFESLVQDLKKNLVEVMEELSEQQRLVIALHYYEGLSQAEVSRVLNLSMTDVEQFQETALARLRAAVSLMA
jgi:RNA polymerase sigma factor (sigma-70 family)